MKWQFIWFYHEFEHLALTPVDYTSSRSHLRGNISFQPITNRCVYLLCLLGGGNLSRANSPDRFICNNYILPICDAIWNPINFIVISSLTRDSRSIYIYSKEQRLRSEILVLFRKTTDMHRRHVYCYVFFFEFHFVNIFLGSIVIQFHIKDNLSVLLVKLRCSLIL